jgi:uncharacterized protein
MSFPDFVIQIARLKTGDHTQSIAGTVAPSDLDIADELRFHFHEVAYDLCVQLLGARLIVRGALSMPCDMECRRCAEFFSTSVRVSSFLRAYEIRDGMETVDLTADIREDILLELPSFPLCKDSCKGLCPHCGKNLNEGPCSCRPEPDNLGRWATLDKLRLNRPK